MSYNPNRPKQHKLEPENALEEQFLKGCSILGGPNNDSMFVNAVDIKSVIRDMERDDVGELIWPTKEVKVKSQVTFVMPHKEEMQVEEVERVHRVPLTIPEVAEHFRKRAEELDKFASEESGRNQA